MTGSRRFAILAERDINKETFVEPWPEVGLIVADSPYDPQPSLRIEGGPRGRDGRQRARRLRQPRPLHRRPRARPGAVAEEAMATPVASRSRGMLVDINVPQAEVRRLACGCTPAKLVEIIRHMNVLEMMMGLAQDARAPHAGQPGARHQLARAPGAAGRRRRRGRAARLRRGRDHRARGALRALQRAGDPGRHADRARRRADPVRGRGGAGAAAGDEGADHLRRDPLGLRHRARLRRRRRHPLVEGVPGRRPTPRAASRCASPPAPARRR